jgi:hypothetical protein
MSDEKCLCVNCDREYRTEIQEVFLCPACTAKVDAQRPPLPLSAMLDKSKAQTQRAIDLANTLREQLQEWMARARTAETEVAVVHAFLSLAEAQRNSLRKRYM